MCVMFVLLGDLPSSKIKVTYCILFLFFRFSDPNLLSLVANLLEGMPVCNKVLFHFTVSSHHSFLKIFIHLISFPFINCSKIVLGPGQPSSFLISRIIMVLTGSTPSHPLLVWVSSSLDTWSWLELVSVFFVVFGVMVG